MTAQTKRKLGRVDLDVPAFALGLAPIGNFLAAIGEAESDAIVRSAWDASLRYYDTSPMYGRGLWELQTGHSLRWRRRDDYVLSSKVGRLLSAAPRAEIDFAPWVDARAFKARFDHSYDGERQPEMFAQVMAGSAKALERLRDEKVVKAIGVGCNEWEVCHEGLKQRDFDCFLLAGRYTLLEHDALDAFVPLCLERGAAVVVGGGFNAGILATGARPGAKYNYQPAPPAIKQRTAKIEQICAEFAVPLAAAALQFVVAHPAIASFIAGVRNLAQLQQNLDWFSKPIPAPSGAS